ncbi:hypothetical protein PFLUV_G00105570 [Perca fluviatilis]|uniref:Tudor domain-containing protein n=1 Tax=Perca fluviatilis TaxID=8168 RepID=A0A6A5F2Z6_PERFL|nr:hypothetical protein PFLUV_G00105570 [Perca fluviatilis]
MDEETKNTVVNGPAEPEESGTAVRDELLAAFKISLDISQDSESPESASSEKTQSWEKPEQRDGPQDGEREGEGERDGQVTRQQEGQKNGERAGQQDGERDGETVPPPSAEWAVGAQCRAVWSEDGRLYPATVLCLDGERCRVRFNGYGNQQDMDLSALKRPDAAPPTHRQNSQDWKPGARCRAVYVEDGLVYPAVVLWVKGQRCGVRFNDYNNEEEVDVDSLMNPDELRGPSRAKGSNWQVIVTNGKVDWKMRKKEESQGERGGERRREESQEERGGERRRDESRGERGGTRVKDKASNRRKVEKEDEKKRGNQQRDEAEKPANHSFSFFPPFPPPPSPRLASGDAVAFIPPPPPPPLWVFGGKESSSAAVDASSSMLMLWYMCGFHTGSYMAQQGFQSSSKD